MAMRDRSLEEEREEIARSVVDEGILETPDQLNGLSSIPGFGMTQPKGKWAWENPPQFSDPNEAIDAIVEKFDEEPTKSNLLKVILAGVSIEEIINTTVMNGFTEGKFSPDVAELIKPALTIKLLTMAQEKDVPVRMFVDQVDSGEMEDEQLFRIMQERNPTMFKELSEKINEEIRMGTQPAPPTPQPKPSPVSENSFLNIGN
tara:strand:+ start:1053 stop:1661 length:609 start_codon:yes stop_codon:yes gene_type:complete